MYNNIKRLPIRILVLLAVVGISPVPASASYGVFTHGYGIKSLSMGGIGFSEVEESYAISANPATTLLLEDRVDFGMDYLLVLPDSEISGNTAGPNQDFDSKHINVFIPQAGFTRRLKPDLAIGMTAFSAGLKTDYSKNPYARFGASGSAGLSTVQSGATAALAWSPLNGQYLGGSLNISWQKLELRGIGFLAPFSADPARLSNNGNSGSLGVSATFGWIGKFTDFMQIGLSYRTKTWTQRHTDYAGAVPDHGRLELPAIYGGGLSIRPSAHWNLAVEYQRVLYAEEIAFKNGIAALGQGHRFGSRNGPGFGWDNQDIYKLGIRYDGIPEWTFRAGYSFSDALVEPEETLLAILAQTTTEEHFTFGATRHLGKWEITGYLAYAPNNVVEGKNSISPAFGGGEVDVNVEMFIGGFSISRPLSAGR